MPKSKKSMQAVTFTQPMKVEVRPIRMTRAPSLAYLDVNRLNRAAKAEFEVGHIVTGKKRRTVRATVRNGMVVGLRIEGCAGCKSVTMSPPLRELVAAARRRVDPKASPLRPIRVREFLADPEIETSHCFLFCFIWFCVLCCRCCSEVDDGTGCVILDAYENRL